MAQIRDEAGREYERVPREALKFFQGELKELSRSEYENLKGNIESEGFFEPIEVWKDAQGTLWVIDGHQRLQVMDRESWVMPDGIPIRHMPADSRDHAARRLLMVNARYAHITGQGLYAFLHEFNIAPEELKKFQPPEIRYEAFVAEFFGEPSGPPNPWTQTDNQPERTPGKTFADVEEGEEEGGGERQEYSPNDPRIEPTPIFEFSDNAILPSSNKWGIPDLRTDRLFADAALIPRGLWSAQPEDPTNEGAMFLWSKTAQRAFKPELAHGGVLCFYEWDYKFNQVWDDAVEAVERLSAVKWAGVIEPDFSIFASSPLAMQLWALYRIRWVGRYWQEAGFNIIPNAAIGDERTREWAFGSIPRNTPVVAMQMHSKMGTPQMMYEILLRDVQWIIEDVNPQHIIIYGGASGKRNLEAVQSLPPGPTYHPLNTWTAQRFETVKRERRQRGE